ncbi:programmed cell death protein 4 isoform X1 [Hetaerina americana]|uniref:programmed cell death protein 4 isoform X1 n=1 Tax=Hetaerina americana TaxID=62018 RepID=UPI003A7F386F
MMDSDVINGHDVDLDGVSDGIDENGVGLSGVGVDGERTIIDADSTSVNTDTRIKKKAKRLIKQLSKEAVPNGSSVVQTTRHWKNSRRPRNGFGRGLPKKGGAGGKGVWGKLGSELWEDDVDMKDPNYDSDTEADVELKTIIPEMTDEQLQKAVEPIVLEYFEHGDTAEASLSLDELNCRSKRFLLIRFAIELAMDHKPSHREMTSVLISDLYGRLVSQKDIAKAFDVLMKNLPDLILDTPEAPVILGNFLARAVADDCLPPKFVHSYRDKIECEHARLAFARAETLLSLEHGMTRLDNVWGVGGGLRPVKSLIRQMSLLLQEYLSSGDIKEATRCIVELEVPHFHHELVYEALVMTIEALNRTTEEKMCKLLKSLCSAVIITTDMMERGFLRVFEDMPDICLDVPLAYAVLERFVERCQKAGILTDEIIKKVPASLRLAPHHSRLLPDPLGGRKRFVSEGDGGRVKTDPWV